MLAGMDSVSDQSNAIGELVALAAGMQTLDVSEVANVMHCDEQTVMDLAKSGELMATKIGRGWIFIKLEVFAFIRARMETETNERRESRRGSSKLVSEGTSRKPLPNLPDVPNLPIAYKSRQGRRKAQPRPAASSTESEAGSLAAKSDPRRDRYRSSIRGSL
jgi:excisionase family DNA binding protein